MEILLNVDMIKTVDVVGEQTVITMIDEEKLLVKNMVIDVLVKMRAYRTGISEEIKNYENEPDKDR